MVKISKINILPSINAIKLTNLNYLINDIYLIDEDIDELDLAIESMEIRRN